MDTPAHGPLLPPRFLDASRATAEAFRRSWEQAAPSPTFVWQQRKKTVAQSVDTPTSRDTESKREADDALTALAQRYGDAHPRTVLALILVASELAEEIESRADVEGEVYPHVVLDRALAFIHNLAWARIRCSLLWPDDPEYTRAPLGDGHAVASSVP